MDWDTLLTKDIPQRKHESTYKKYTVEKSGNYKKYVKGRIYEQDPFDKAYESIISHRSFRRLQDKTQVFPLSKSDFIRTRLTHSLEVSTIAGQLGTLCFKSVESKKSIDKKPNKEQIYDIQRILSCAGLLHDLGNPPFGHVGEEIIGNWFKENSSKIPGYELLTENQVKGLENFDGNAQGLRLLLKAHNELEIDLPYSVISAFMKYPTTSDKLDPNTLYKKKIGCYQAEKSFFEEVSKKVATFTSDETFRHPLAYIVEAADDIAYCTADVEDAVKLQLLTVDDLIAFLNKSLEEVESDENIKKYPKELISALEGLNNSCKDKVVVMTQWRKYVRTWLMYVATYTFTSNYHKIMDGTFEHHLFHNNNHTATVELLRRTMQEYIYYSPTVVTPETSGETILGFLLDTFVPALARYKSGTEQSEKDKRICGLVSPNLLNDYENGIEKIQGNSNDEQGERLYLRLLTATDFISGMTDRYAKRLYRDLSGIEWLK